MGAWGDGIFENDTALDELSETYNELICRLMGLFAISGGNRQCSVRRCWCRRPNGL